jgi:hypothetical protein
MGKRRTHQEIAEQAVRNDRRLEHVNEWLRKVDPERWAVISVSSISGFIMGVWMKRKSDGYAILAQELYMVQLIDAGWHTTGRWPSAEEATAWLALRERAQAQEGAAQ